MTAEPTRHNRPPPLFDNHALAHEHITSQPFAGAMGARVTGVDLNDVSEETFAEIEAALFHHKVVCFPGQQLSHANHEAFTARFGSFATDAFTPGLEGFEGIQPVIKEVEATVPMVFGGSWHTDSAFLASPPSITTLHAIEVPEFGGDTLYTNTALAYRALSETMRSMIAPLRVHMSAEKVLAGRARRGNRSNINAMTDKEDEWDAMLEGSYHPLVRTHDRTGEKALYVDQTYAVGIKGMRRREAESLISFLVEHVTQPAFTCRVRWEPGMLVMWDNRCALHHAFNDYDGSRREMYRTIVQGSVPA
jgi:alpha-ketoglutarate-dependent taurine dioxygenase